MKSCRFIMLILWLLALPVVRAAESADTTFANAMELADTDLTAARDLYRVAALRYLDEAQAWTAERGPLLYNAGNAFFLAGDAGRAVVAYRRARQEMPGSSLLLDNLSFVRKQSGNAEEAADASRLGNLYFWRWNPASLWISLAAAWLLLAATFFHQQWSGKSWPRASRAILLAFAAIMAGTLLFQTIRENRLSRGVMVAQVEVRKGPNYGYAPAFTAPMDAGMECVVEGGEGDWLHVRFDRQRHGWVRKSTVEIWNQAPQRRIRSPPAACGSPRPTPHPQPVRHPATGC